MNINYSSKKGIKREGVEAHGSDRKLSVRYQDAHSTAARHGGVLQPGV